MKKIMFNDRYGLTQAVLDGRKTMTRRIIPEYLLLQFGHNAHSDKSFYLINHAPFLHPYNIVAVAQSGNDIYHALQQRYGETSDAALGFQEMYKGMPMWNNKMFVPADLCPNKIEITGIKVERLQNISDVDCLKEGITKHIPLPIEKSRPVFSYEGFLAKYWFGTPHVAFAALIDKVCGKGTWERNPYVFAYEFKLIN